VIWLAVEPTDMRCGFDRLAERVRVVVGQSTLSGQLFVFGSRRGRRLRILVWDRRVGYSRQIVTAKGVDSVSNRPSIIDNDGSSHGRSLFMAETTSAEASGEGMRGSQANTDNKLQAKSVLTKIAAFVADRNIPFLVCSIGMIVMLLWAGKFKMTAPGAEGIIPLVTNSPLTSWQFKIFGPYILGDIIGATEWTAAILLIIGYFKPKAGILGGIILVGMFFTTSSMLITTPDDTVVVHGIHYMNNLGLFLFKDIISFGVAFYLISYYGRKAIMAENQR
jgi:uncharacterized membrane protein YkgB